jgi:SAM-dependent methyltransferase
MISSERIDGGRPFDWGRTSDDYATHRPGPPQSFFERLRALGVGLPGQRILDLATGTGVLARQFARQGAAVTGIDIASEQIAAASQLAAQDGVSAHFAVAAAETTGLPGGSFDAVTANQCWMYFDKDRILPEIGRLLAADGVLVVSFFSWLPGGDAIAKASEELVLEFNPQWQGARWDGHIPPMPAWAQGKLELTAMFWYDEAIPFTRASWRGRFRACRGTGATLDAAALAAFDAAHDALLRQIAPDTFTILHRINAHILRPIRAARNT